MKFILLLSAIISLNSFAGRGVITAEEAKNINVEALAGTYLHKKGFGIELVINSNNPNPRQGDLFKPTLPTQYTVSIYLNDKASNMQWDETFLDEGTPYVSVDKNGDITMSFGTDYCDDPQCTTITTEYTFSPNKKKSSYSLTASSEISNDAEQGIEEEGMEDNPIEYCEMFFENALYVEGINEYDGRTCEGYATYYMSKK